MTRLLVAVLLVLSLVLSGCTQSELVISLDAAAVATAAASATLSGVSGIPPDTLSLIQRYLSVTGDGLSRAASAAQAGTLSGAQIAAIVADLTSVAVPSLPPSVPDSVRTALLVASSAVFSFVMTLQRPTVIVESAAPGAMSFAARSHTTTTYHLKLSKKDRKRLQHAIDTLQKSRARRAAAK